MICCAMPAKLRESAVITSPQWASDPSAKFIHAAQPAKITQANDIGRVTDRQRFVRVGWTNFSRRNIDTVSRITARRMTQGAGDMAKRTNTTIFQQAGKPEKDLSLVFMRVSAK